MGKREAGSWVKRGLLGVVREHRERGVVIGALLLALLLSLISQLSLIRTARAPIPYVVEVDPLGRPIVLGPVEALDEGREAVVVAAVLQDVIVELRTLYQDPRQQKEALYRAFELLRGDAARFVQGFFSREGEGPLRLARDFGRSVELRSVLKLAQPEGAWEVEWTETLYPRRAGLEPEVSAWKASVVVRLEAPEQETILSNPFGVFLTGLRWTKRLRGEVE